MAKVAEPSVTPEPPDEVPTEKSPGSDARSDSASAAAADNGAENGGGRGSICRPPTSVRKQKRHTSTPTMTERQEEKRRRRRMEKSAAADVVAGDASPAAEQSGVQPAVAALPAAAAPAPAGRAPSPTATPDDDPIGDERSREPQRGPDLQPQRTQEERDRLKEELAARLQEFDNQGKRLRMNMADLGATRKVLCELLVHVAKFEDADERDRVAAAKYQLGYCRQIVISRAEWEGGYETEMIGKLRERNKEDRSAVERRRRELAKQERTRAKLGDRADGGGDDDDADELWEAREISNVRLSFVGRDEQQVKERENRLQIERGIHVKRIQRLEAAERSNFRTYPVYGKGERVASDRYQLLNMIGRGGFSEVYGAYDLETNQYCAVKIHELGKDMTDTQRQCYIKRAMREHEIQKSLQHPRVVTLQDCFPINAKAFGTVLELCKGETLDEYMRRYGPLKESEARGIVIQILSGLKYMNTNGRKIIHYDLKPSNLFFHNGEIKIADFGLSKIVRETDGADSIELTSQGAGTYWYLPPECFIEAGQANLPKISNKVDVWSTGVIFFELLFNRRPFGHNQSQEALLKATMAASQRFAVEFPNNVRISSDAKDLCRRLLTISREARPDVLEAFNDPYLRKRPQGGSAVVPASAVGGAGGAS